MIYGGFPSQEKALRNAHVRHKRSIMLNCAEYGKRVAQSYNISDDGTVSVALPNQELEKDIEDFENSENNKIYISIIFDNRKMLLPENIVSPKIDVLSQEVDHQTKRAVISNSEDSEIPYPSSVIDNFMAVCNMLDSLRENDVLQQSISEAHADEITG